MAESQSEDLTEARAVIFHCPLDRSSADATVAHFANNIWWQGTSAELHLRHASGTEEHE